LTLVWLIPLVVIPEGTDGACVSATAHAAVEAVMLDFAERFPNVL
jgi:hypothetical protein